MAQEGTWSLLDISIGWPSVKGIVTQLSPVSCDAPERSLGCPLVKNAVFGFLNMPEPMAIVLGPAPD